MPRFRPYALWLALLACPAPALATLADLSVCADGDCEFIVDEPFGTGNVQVPNEIEVEEIQPAPRQIFASDGTTLLATLSATASGKVGLGSLHAAAAVDVIRPGNASLGPVAIDAYSSLEYLDSVKVLSDSLPTGTPVMLSAYMPIAGTGRGSADLSVRIFGRAGGFADSDTATLFQTLESLGGSFEAQVGDILNVTMKLTARASFTVGSCCLPPSPPGGTHLVFASDYGNSAYLYLSAVDPGIDVVFQGSGGYTYLQPAPVPEPETYALMLAGLGLVFARRYLGRNRPA